MFWLLSHCCDPRGRALADRHYPRQTPGAARFVAPGSPLVLITGPGDAVWATLEQEHQDHAWPGAWVCTIFRNEAPHLYRSSELVVQACAATRAIWGEPPAQGLITFVDDKAIRHKRDPGRCFRRAGFKPVGRTKERDRLVLQLLPDAFPPAEFPLMAQLALLEVG